MKKTADIPVERQISVPLRSIPGYNRWLNQQLKGTSASGLSLVLLADIARRIYNKKHGIEESDNMIGAEGALSGALGGYGSLTLDNPLKYMITRRQAANELPVYAGMSFGGRQGTGELSISSNLAKALRAKGFNTVLYDPEVLNARNHMALYKELVDKLGKDKADELLGPYIWSSFKGTPDAAAKHDFEMRLYGLAPSGNVSIDQFKGKTVAELLQIAKDKDNPASVVVSMLRKPGEPDVNPRLVRRFLKKVNSGAFDGIDLGTLRDYFKVSDVQDVLSGKIRLGPPDQMRSALGRAKQFASGEAGMFYSAIPLSRRDDWDVVELLNGFRGGKEYHPFADSRIKHITPDLIRKARESGVDISDFKSLSKWLDSNAEPYLHGGNPTALHSVIGMNANFSPEREHVHASDELIPFAKIRSSALDSIPGISHFRRRLDRRAVIDFILKNNQNLGLSDLQKKKLVLLTSGGSGLDIESKLQALAEALEGRDDVHILVQGGTPSEFNRNLASIAERINAGHDGKRVTLFSSAPHRLFSRLGTGVDVVASYGGSSTLMESLASRTPSVFLHDQQLNRNNLDWAKKRFGITTADTAAYHARKTGDRLAAELGITPEYFWSHNAWIPKSVRDGTIGGGFSDYKLPGSRNKIGDIAEHAATLDRTKFIQDFRANLNRLLDNPAAARSAKAKMRSRFLNMLTRRNASTIAHAKAIAGGLHVPGKYKALAAVIGALGVGGSAYGASKYLGRPKRSVVSVFSSKPSPGKNSSTLPYALAGGVGAGALLAAAVHAASKRKKQREQEEDDFSQQTTME